MRGDRQTNTQTETHDLCLLGARWTEDYVVAYEQHYSLAQFFSEDPDDKWLADHFYFNCMNVAIKMKDDGGQMRAEASINAGKVFESLGK